jgi:putative ABC transport system permease protein
MAAPRSTNRSMFWRIVRRLLGANRGRLFVILLALGAGAAVTAALLNLQLDAKRRLTTEFRDFGPTIVIAPRDATGSAAGAQTLDQSLLDKVPQTSEEHQVSRIGFLYLIADAFPQGRDKTPLDPSHSISAVVAGYTGGITQETLSKFPKLADNLPYCDLGSKVASQLKVHHGDKLLLRKSSVEELCYVWAVWPSFGGQEDDQIFVHVETAQRLAALPGRLSLIQVVVPGTPKSIDRYIADLTQRIPDANVRPIRQFTEAEGKIYNRISGLLTATVALVLVLTALCVMAAMTNVAMERKNDVGLMKAIGGATRRVLRLFLAEAAVLGLVGGALGAAAGIVLSIGLGQAVFGVAARPRLIVYPIAVALTILVAIAGAYPLRRLASVRPASVFRGEA